MRKLKFLIRYLLLHLVLLLALTVMIDDFSPSLLCFHERIATWPPKRGSAWNRCFIPRWSDVADAAVRRTAATNDCAMFHGTAATMGHAKASLPRIHKR